MSDQGSSSEVAEDVHQQALRDLKSSRQCDEAYRSIRYSPGQRLFKKGHGDYTDVLIKCGEKEWKAHSCVLKSASSFFKGCLESSCQEAQSHVIDLRDDDPVACGIFLEFLYTGSLEYPDNSWASALQSQPRYDPTWNDPNVTHWEDVPPEQGEEFVFPGAVTQTLMDLCRMADKYMVPSLIEAIADVFAPDPNFGNQQNVFIPLYVVTHELGKSAEVLLLQEFLLRNITKASVKHGQLSVPCKDFLHEYPEAALEILTQQLEQVPAVNAKVRCEATPCCGDCDGDHHCCGWCGRSLAEKEDLVFRSSTQRAKCCSQCYGYYSHKSHWED